jgi:hypothetical protein
MHLAYSELEQIVSYNDFKKEKKESSPSIQPNGPRLIAPFPCFGNQRSIFALRRPEEQGVVWYTWAVYGDVPCPGPADGERDVG